MKWQMLKNMDSSAWPPSMVVLREKIKQTNLVANIFLCSHEPSHSSYSLLNNGWQLDGDILSLKWYEGEIMPSNLEEFTVPFNEEEEFDNDGGEESSNSETDEMDED